MDEVRNLIDGVIQTMDTTPQYEGVPGKVPLDKLSFNRISGPWHHMLASGSWNAPFVADYLEQHPDAEVRGKVARVFKQRYVDLKAQGLAPNAILTTLYEGITGIGSVPPERQVAAQALLTFLFDHCDIFEDHPSKVAA